MLGSTILTGQLVLDGVVYGLIVGLLAMGVVLVYRATRVINFAVGNMGLVASGLLAILVLNYGVPFGIAVVLALAAGVLFAVVMELIVVRRLFFAPRVTMLVATIGIAGVALAVVFGLPEVDRTAVAYPVVSTGAWQIADDLRLTGVQLSVLAVVPVVAVALSWFLNRTLLGRTVKASAENPDLARVRGINPKLVSTAVWAIAGLIASIAMILVSGLIGTPGEIAALGPSTLVRALVAAVIAGMVSFPRALLAGLVIGVAQSVVTFNFLDKPGLIDGLLFVVALVGVALQSRSRSGDETQTFSFTPKVRAIPAQVRDLWWVRHGRPLGLLVAIALAVLLPIMIPTPSRILVFSVMVAMAICALSLTVLTGWSGQISLGQMAFAGISALLAAGFVRGLDLDLGVVHINLAALPFTLSILLGAVVVSALAAGIGAGALRVRGLFLSVITFVFAVAAAQYLYRQPFLSGGSTGLVGFFRGELFGLDLSAQRTYYWFVLGVLAVVFVVVHHLRNSGVGRTTIAVRDNADSAAAYTVRTVRSKVAAFALAGFLAGLGGALLAGAIEGVPFADQYFLVNDSLLLVAMVVIGGLSSPSGAVLGAIWIMGIPELFPDNDLVPLLTSSLGLLILILYFPGGLVQIGYSARDALLGWVARRRGEVDTSRVTVTPRALQRGDRPLLAPGVPALEADGVVVRFGGNTAVDGVSLVVQPGEVVGLIGTNGAGKSTLMNAIGGFVPSSGSVRLHGVDVTRASASRRARMGLGRTFQAARLFPELTVRETVEVALEARHRTNFVETALFLPTAGRRERRRRAEADDLVGFLGLGRYADVRIADLSTGTRRIVELAGLLALDARVLCLDEPTAGVAQRETEAFGPLILEIRRELDAAMLVIEHDMPLIMGISDRVYCLEVGRVIAEGDPATVRNDPLVIASYLGMDERAIARSGAAAGPSRVEEPA